MAGRPERNDADHFPFLCKEGKALYFIEQKYGNDGYATWIKILRQLTVTSYHYLNLSDQSELMFLAAKCRVSEELLLNIIDDLVKLGEFPVDFWSGNRILFSEKLVKSLHPLYEKRRNECLSKDNLLQHLTNLGVLKLNKSNGNSISGGINTQSKVNYSKVNYSKERGFTPPKLKMVIDYFFKNAAAWNQEKIEREANKFINHYESNGWKVGKNKMQRWKSAAAGWIIREQEKLTIHGNNSNSAKSTKTVGSIPIDVAEEFINRGPIPEFK